MGLEKFESQKPEKSDFDRLLGEKQGEGWHYVGIEQLFTDRLKTETGKFEPTPYQTEEDIIRKYKEKFEKQLRGEGNGGEIEITLVPKPSEMFEGIPLPDKDKSFYVFAKVKGEQGPNEV